MTLASINTECLKLHLTTVSTRLGSPGLSYYSKAKKYVSRASRLSTDGELQQPVYHKKLSSLASPDLISMPPVKAKQKA